MQRDDEIVARLINIELKLNDAIQGKKEAATAGSGKAAWAGHRDQAFGPYTYAQHGEDLIIVNIFHRLQIERPDYIDIGAHHPLNVSNTALLYERGSRGINVEANPDLIGAFREIRPDDVNLNIGIGPSPGVLPFYRIDNFSGRNSFDLQTINSFTSSHTQFTLRDTIEVPVIKLNHCIDEYNKGRFPRFLSIDVEGLDFDILNEANFENSKPDVMCVEVVSGSDLDQRSKMVSMLKQKGFEPIFETIGNVLFINASLKAQFTI